MLGGLLIESFGHQVALVVEEAAATVEFDGGVAVGDLEVVAWCSREAASA